MELLFWLSLLVLGYVFVGYPLSLAVLRKIIGRKVYKDAIEPTVSVIVAVHNERERIQSRIRNLLALDYPEDKLQIIVAVDGSTDGTDAVVRRCDPRRVTLVSYRRHAGKAAAINHAMLRATGDITIFTDARQTFERRAIRELVANFADTSVGGVTGELVLVNGGLDQECAAGIGAYWRYETLIRSLESEIHSVVGATGAIYAIRRTLFTPLPEDAILDDVIIPMKIVLSGQRVVFDSSAKAFDSVSCCARAEYKRKVRTLAGNYQLLTILPQILTPRRNPVAWQLWSHKIGRLAAPFMLMAVFLSNALLVDQAFYAGVFMLQSVGYGCALMGYIDAAQTAAPVAPTVATTESRRAA